jgi:hypothetical protein
MRVKVREWLLRAALLSGSIVFALVVAEVMVRIIHPIYDGRDNVKLDGTPIKGWFEPGSVYRQVSNEYDAQTTITEKGHRSPRVDGSPDVIFVGDSFTFGWGLTDEETFVSIYCQERRRSCANLGAPGTGTARQVARLKQFLSEWNWRPREVKLFFFGMSTSFSSGNDFVDNYNFSQRQHAATAGEAPAPLKPPAAPLTLVERIVSSQEVILRSSNLVRLAKFYWGPMLRSMVVADPGESRMAEALTHTQKSLQELDDLSRQAGFEYQIYLVVPVQDIIRHSYADTLATLDSVSPKPAISTAPLFVESPQNFYYAYDGHLNARGSRRVAEFLISQETNTAGH